MNGMMCQVSNMTFIRNRDCTSFVQRKGHFVSTTKIVQDTQWLSQDIQDKLVSLIFYTLLNK
jgi:hypothetical protein